VTNKEKFAIGGYLTPMEIAIDSLLMTSENVKRIKKIVLILSKAILYVTPYVANRSFR
jgi:hypothetical protein